MGIIDGRINTDRSPSRQRTRFIINGVIDSPIAGKISPRSFYDEVWTIS